MTKLSVEKIQESSEKGISKGEFMYKSEDIKKLLGLRIKELRKIKGLTQEQSAEKMEIDQ